MRTVVFLGPTLPVTEARALLVADYLPPAAFGDVYRAALRRPVAIAIIDGVFERQPTVWHKEILWAMTQGVHVLGASSMGALRAAELSPLGMVGIGRIFEAFRTGELQDDDEVAVVHGPAETGYACSSVAMVDMRATLVAALEEAIIDHDTKEALLRIGKRYNFRERSYPALLRAAAREGVAGAELDRLAQWFPTGRVQQKRADAIELLRELARWQKDPPPPHQPSFSFSRTDAWESARVQMDRGPGDSPGGAGADASILEELAVTGRFSTVFALALDRALAARLAESSGYRPDRESMLRAGASLGAEHGLGDKSRFASWLDEQGLDAATLPSFLREEATLRWARTIFRNEAEAQVASMLRARGEWAATVSRSVRKREQLEAAGLDSPSLGDAGLTEDALWTWYFEDVVHVPMPPDLAEYAAVSGFSGLTAMRRAVLRERLFRELHGS